MNGDGGIDWIGVDWGTTNLRAWAMRGGDVVATASAPVGMASLTRDAFEPALLAVIGDWLADVAVAPLPVIACGMVGARQGWREAPYVAVPCPPLVRDGMICVSCEDSRIGFTIVHGLSQAQPADVMRGEETQIAGLLAMEPDFAGLACLPGTHTKWATIRDGRIDRFRTFMTGELFDLLARHSVLRHVTGDTAPFDEATFDAAVHQAASNPAALAADLFSIRAAALLEGTPPHTARARLSGLLIGLEIAALGTEIRDAQPAVIGTDTLAGLYERAIRLHGGKARRLDGGELARAGLGMARNLMLREDRN